MNCCLYKVSSLSCMSYMKLVYVALFTHQIPTHKIYARNEKTTSHFYNTHHHQ